MKKLVDFFFGQTQLGKKDEGAYYSLDNCDIHNEYGILQPQKELGNEETTPTITEATFSAIIPNGDVYFFSKTTGKIWKRTSAGVYSLVHTNTNTAHRGCRYFNGYLWYWTATKLGYFNLVSTWTDSFATFTNGNARGCVEANNTLIIGDGRNLARIDGANTVDLNAFVIPAMYSITDLISVGDDVLIGTYVGTEVSYCKAFLWNTLDSSWTIERELFEIGINQFVKLDNYILAQVGTEGRFYLWTGANFQYFGKIRGVTTALGEQLWCNYKRRLLVAIGTKIYSIHRESDRLNYAFCGEYTATGTISSLLVKGSSLLVPISNGVNVIKTTYDDAVIETPEFDGKFSRIVITYDSIPAGTDIGVQVKINNGSYGDEIGIETSGQSRLKKDETQMTLSLDGGVNGSHNKYQVKITLHSNGTSYPKINNIII